MSISPGSPLVILARFAGSAEILHAAEKMADSEYHDSFDCHSPFPIHGMDEAMKLKRSPLGWIVGLVALVTLSAAVYMMYWMTTVDYRLVISGKPFFSYQAYLPIAFALTILASAFAATLGMFHLNKLPRPNHPLFESEQFGKFSNDAFFISLDMSKGSFDVDKAHKFMEEIGGSDLEVILK